MKVRDLMSIPFGTVLYDRDGDRVYMTYQRVVDHEYGGFCLRGISETGTLFWFAADDDDLESEVDLFFKKKVQRKINAQLYIDHDCDHIVVSHNVDLWDDIVRSEENGATGIKTVTITYETEE